MQAESSDGALTVHLQSMQVQDCEGDTAPSVP